MEERSVMKGSERVGRDKMNSRFKAGEVIKRVTLIRKTREEDKKEAEGGQEAGRIRDKKCAKIKK